MKTDHYEAEVKFEISENDLASVQDTLRNLGLRHTGKETLEDYYLHTKRSRYNGWDFVRLRKSNEKYILTQKTWQQDVNGVLIRQEEEGEVSYTDANEMLQRGYKAQLVKTRHDYVGHVEGDELHVSIDFLELDGATRYFLECERLVAKEDAAKAREQLRRWVEENLAIDTTHEAPSMLELITQPSRH